MPFWQEHLGFRFDPVACRMQRPEVQPVICGGRYADELHQSSPQLLCSEDDLCAQLGKMSQDGAADAAAKLQMAFESGQESALFTKQTFPGPRNSQSAGPVIDSHYLLVRELNWAVGRFSAQAVSVEVNMTVRRPTFLQGISPERSAS